MLIRTIYKVSVDAEEGFAVSSESKAPEALQILYSVILARGPETTLKQDISVSCMSQQYY